ncbi:MAG: ATP phosphoribosyltransferase regulatory subunit [Lachnospiraceae bacterium]|nr:ATP phosphoribosyltransferase regulatory subunit [Lachnospiraceae bacterium]
MNLSLLHTPDGVRDFYGIELDYKNYIMNRFEENIKLYGYDEIQTPTLEFLNVFLEETNYSYESKTFRFIDRDGETLVLRPDYTPSVARCAVKYFSDENYPLRFFYKGNAFSNKGLYEGKAIEVTQMGIELLKDDTYLADAEVLTIVIKNLIAIGLEDFKICVNTKEEDTSRLNKVISLLNDYGYSKYITYDPDIDSNFMYYTGMVFKVYTYGVGDSICKGGRYNSLLEKYGEGVPAVGCVFMIDNILQSLKKQKIEMKKACHSKIYLIYDDENENDAIKKAEEYRKQDRICVLVKNTDYDDTFKDFCASNDYKVEIFKENS